MPVGGSSNPKCGRIMYASWRVIDMLEFTVSEEWVTSIYGSGMRDFGSRFGEVRVHSKLSSNVCAHECISCIHSRKLLDKELVESSGLFRDHQ